MIPYAKLSQCFLERGLDETSVVKCLKELSEAFTQRRDKIDTLYSSKKHISSYSSFYLPTNMYKMEFLLDNLNEAVIEDIKSSTIVEVGTGPGTYIFALLSYFEDISSSFVGVDHSPLMLEQARAIHDNVFPCADITWRSDIPPVKGKKTFIFGNSLNEMGHYTALKIVNANDAETVICIEPGTKSSFAEMSQFRDKMIKAGYNIIYPCFSNKACPILKKKDDWCHQVVKTKLDDSIERISQMAKLDRKTMPAIIHVYTKTNLSEREGGRIIRLVKNVKHAFIWEVCVNEEDEQKVFRVEAPKKQFKKKELKTLEKMSAGLEINFELDRRLDENFYRIKNITVK